MTQIKTVAPAPPRRAVADPKRSYKSVAGIVASSSESGHSAVAKWALLFMTCPNTTNSNWSMQRSLDLLQAALPARRDGIRSRRGHATRHENACPCWLQETQAIHEKHPKGWINVQLLGCNSLAGLFFVRVMCPLPRASEPAIRSCGTCQRWLEPGYRPMRCCRSQQPKPERPEHGRRHPWRIPRCSSTARTKHPATPG